MLKLSLIIPIYNEANHLEKFLKLIDEIDLGVEKQLVFVDDHSSDNSLSILKGYNFKTNDILIDTQPVNQGKGAALQKGFKLATGDIICVQDADFEYDPHDLPRLIKPFIEDKADVVFGSRFKKDHVQIYRTFHYLINRFLTLVSNLLSGLYLTDMETCYKLFRADIIKNINFQSKRFGFEPEVTSKIARLHIRMMEYPVSYYPRNYLEGKKITWKDGVAALWHIINFNLFRSKSTFFKDKMPKEYLPSGRLWL